MDRKITDLESIIEPISVLFRRARITGNLDVPAPNNMHFSENNTITLVWNLSDVPAIEAVRSFDKIKGLASSEFDIIDHGDIGIVIYTSKIVWHGEYPEVNFRVVMSREVMKCPNSTGNQSVSS